MLSLVLVLAFIFASTAEAFPGSAAIKTINSGTRTGTASYYTYESCKREGTSGVWTASGERYDENDMTCAMRRRDWGGVYKVTNIDNGKSVVVRHNDFGPNKKLYNKGRIVDLSKGAFEKIGNLRKGILRVTVEKVS